MGVGHCEIDEDVVRANPVESQEEQRRLRQSELGGDQSSPDGMSCNDGGHLRPVLHPNDVADVQEVLPAQGHQHGREQRKHDCLQADPHLETHPQTLRHFLCEGNQRQCVEVDVMTQLLWH